MIKTSDTSSQPTMAAVNAASSAGALLRAVRVAEAAVRQAEAEKLMLALEWAHMHPSATGEQDDDDAAAHFYPGGSVAIAGPGCPGVAAFSIAEFGAVLGVSTTSAKTMIGHALELFHRLPRCWARVQSGEVAAWRARRVAEATIHAVPEMSDDAVAWIDAQTAPFLGKVGPAQIDRIIEQAAKNFGLATIEPECPDDPNPPAEPDARHVTVPTRQINSDGTVDLTASLNLADAIDLDNAVRCGAEDLKSLGSTAPLDARRAQALGQIARRQIAFDLSAGDAVRAESTTARRVVLNLHFDASIHPDSSVGVSPTGRLEHGQHLVLLEQVKTWMRDSHTDVRIQPVIDLNAEMTSTGYTPSPRLRRQVELRDRTCVFPWCTRPASSSDLDHTDSYDHDAENNWTDDQGVHPQTRTSNLGALCRFHHRLKTHGRWQVEQLRSGVFLWTSPHGHQFLRDRHGTTAWDADPAPPGKDRPLLN